MKFKHFLIVVVALALTGCGDFFGSIDKDRENKRNEVNRVVGDN